MIPAQTWEHCSFDSVELSSSVCLLVPCKGWREMEQGKQRRSAPGPGSASRGGRRARSSLCTEKEEVPQKQWYFFFFSQYIVRRLCYLELLFVAPRAAV